MAELKERSKRKKPAESAGVKICAELPPAIHPPDCVAAVQVMDVAVVVMVKAPRDATRETPEDQAGAPVPVLNSFWPALPAAVNWVTPVLDW